ncbi:MAG TPA: NUDIX hydrolase [bacterium]|nr:NUDIX hydrolase [Candidatus Omnitrophota bacterium]HOJ60748.1 NUDIX hydrolase [bacterium]HOL96446.1 NUDIX hydrolase [bacterium]HPP02610.1 NUDIX hydrolase [bacterium]HXK93478.1 NUDIX hydrolase [bacterium]
MIRSWVKRESEYIAHYPVFTLRRDICVSPRTGVDIPAYVLETRDWVVVVPITPEGEVIFVRQYRFASEEITWEIPGGLSDASDASMTAAALRELREETGYDSNQIILLGTCRPNPAILNNTCYLFAALNVVRRHDQHLDAGEDIQVERIPLDRISDLILNGTINHSLVLNAFHLLDLQRRNHRIQIG